MINFLLFFTGLVLMNSLRSMKNYSMFNKVYNSLRHLRFTEENGMIISNERAKDEFIIFSDWQFKVYNDYILKFDIWTLVDLHEFYWLLKFHYYFKGKKSHHGKHILFF